MASEPVAALHQVKCSHMKPAGWFSWSQPYVNSLKRESYLWLAGYKGASLPGVLQWLGCSLMEDSNSTSNN
ncbi:hypothetical protein E2C01_041756 [Portunus trituberculatus]|uniref:Uncharacterized protein n=1 Tax=Portunus trituberculatus TaxID=210409 RepID=A0A5B7FSJ8_PORTR|nr:hypothetical protein [Portunus trituberculatus]